MAPQCLLGDRSYLSIEVLSAEAALATGKCVMTSSQADTEIKDKGKMPVEEPKLDPDDFDWFGGAADIRADQQRTSAATFRQPQSETVMSAFRSAVPRVIRMAFFIVVGALLVGTTVVGMLDPDILPEYWGVPLNVLTLTALTVVYLPGLILYIVTKVAKYFRLSLSWSRTELAAYIEATSVPLAVGICGTILYGIWAVELPSCPPDNAECYWKYVHRMYYVMVGGCIVFAIERALMKQWCNNYRRQTYQAKIIDNRFKCYVVEQMKSAARSRVAGAPSNGSPRPAGQQGVIGGLLTKISGYAPIPIPTDLGLTRLRDFSWFKEHLNSVVLMEHYQRAAEEEQVLSDREARIMAKDIFEALCPPDRDYLTREDFAGFVPGDALDDSYYVFDRDRDGSITKLELRNTIVDIYSEQRNLTVAIAEADQAISKLNTIVVTAMWLVTGFVSMIAFDIAVQNMLTLSLSTILGVNVIIGDVVRSILSSIMFVFVNHPYDIGDVVIVGNPEVAEVLTVQRVDLLTTVFRRWNCQELYYANHILITQPITNLARSPDQWERVDFVLPSRVGEEQLDLIRDRLSEFFRSNNVDFFAHFDLRAVVAADSGKAESDLDRIRFSLRVKCKPTNDAEKQWNRHGRLLKVVKQLTEELV